MAAYSPQNSTSPGRAARRALTGLLTAVIAGCAPAANGPLNIGALSVDAIAASSGVTPECYQIPGALPYELPAHAQRVVQAGASGADTYATIQGAVSAAQPGDTILVRPGVYRESVTVRTSDITLWGLPGAVISGANRVDAWSKDAGGNAWTAPLAAPPSSGGQCRDGVNCSSAIALYLDGLPLRRVTPNAALGPKDFSYTGGRVRVVINPGGHTFEAPARAYWLHGEKANNVTVRGLAFSVALPPTQRGGLENGGGNAWRITGNDLAYSHAAGAYLDGENVVFAGNRVHENGQEGLASGFSRGLRVQGNVLACNNTAGFDPFWEAGGAKFSRAHGLVVSDNSVYGNDGPGLWCDIDCDGIEFSHNRSYSNSRQGLHVEISRNAVINGNTVWSNGRGDPYPGAGAGILLQNTSGSRVTGNIVAWNAVGIGIIEHDRGPSHPASGNEVSGNTVISNGGSLISLVFTQGGGNLGTNRVSGNRVWVGSNAAGFEYGIGTLDLNGFSNLTGGGVQLLSTGERNAALTAAGLPLQPAQAQ